MLENFNSISVTQINSLDKLNVKEYSMRMISISIMDSFCSIEVT